MKASCLQENLAEGLGVVGRFLKDGYLPATACVLLSTDNGRLKLTATDLTSVATCWVGAQIEEEGAIAVPGRRFIDFVSHLLNERVELSSDGSVLHVSCDNDSAKFAGLSAEDFPPTPKIEGGVSVRVSGLARAIEQVQFATLTDDVRPVLTGIYLEAKGETLTVMAADGFRAAIRKITLDEEASLSAIIPAKTLREVRRLMPEDVLIEATPSWVRFSTDKAQIGATLIQGTYPNIEQLVPKDYSAEVRCDVKQLEREVALATVFAREENNAVRLEAKPGALSILGDSSQHGQHRGEIVASVEGEGRIALNSCYLRDALSALSSELHLSLTTPNGPCLIQEEDYRCVIMPMFVQW